MRNSTIPSIIGMLLCFATVQAHGQINGTSTASNTSHLFKKENDARNAELNESLELKSGFYPTIELTYEKHDNIRKRSDVEEPDNKISIIPSLSYLTNFGRHNLKMSYNGLFTKHADFDGEDADATTMDIRLGLDVSKRFDVDVFASSNNSFEERGSSGARSYNQLISIDDQSPDEVNRVYYGANIIYGRKYNRLNAILGVEKSDTEYQNNLQGDVSDFTNRDRDDDSINFEVSYKVGTKTEVFTQLQKRDIDYERSVNSLDSKQTNSNVGLRWKLSSRLNGAVAVGKTEKNFNEEQREDYNGKQYYANLNYQLTPFSELKFNASNLVEEPGDNISDFYESQLLSLAWYHSLTDRWSFGLRGRVIEDEYNTDRKDKLTELGTNLDYILRRWLTVGMYFAKTKRDSTEEISSYNDDYIGIRVKADLKR